MRRFDVHNPLADDLVQPFQIDPFQLRGRLVRLGPADRRDPDAARLSRAGGGAAGRGDRARRGAGARAQIRRRLHAADQGRRAGPADGRGRDDGGRGARLCSGRRGAARAGGGGGEQRHEPAGSVPRLLGAGYLALTVDQGEHTERYQGIVELQGATLADCVHHYFRQSEQVEAGLKVAVARVRDATAMPRWRAGSLMIERLPRRGSAAARGRGRGLAPRHDPDELDARRRSWSIPRSRPRRCCSACSTRTACAPMPSRAAGGAVPLLARAGRDHAARARCGTISTT